MHLSYTTNSKSLLDIQDPNITYDENFIKEGTFKVKACKYVLGKLTYNPIQCEACGGENSDYTGYKNGTQSS